MARSIGIPKSGERASQDSRSDLGAPHHPLVPTVCDRRIFNCFADRDNGTTWAYRHQRPAPVVIARFLDSPTTVLYRHVPGTRPSVSGHSPAPDYARAFQSGTAASCPPASLAPKPTRLPLCVPPQARPLRLHPDRRAPEILYLLPLPPLSWCISARRANRPRARRCGRCRDTSISGKRHGDHCQVRFA